ncbi:unnamed protein product [marine sediment metagenome]|uniref:Uncharacterized protein n=1 Tax=marine sediment metagenome TaxID=412755 RepID=X0SWL8_9ZZZZ
MTTKSKETWKPRSRVIKHTGPNDYSEVAKFKVTSLFKEKMADDSAVIVNCFIRRMIRKSKEI